MSQQRDDMSGEAGTEAAGWPIDPELDAVVARVQDGDTEAFRGVVEALDGWLRARIAPRCPPGLDPDEVVHETFIAAYRDLHRYRLGTDLRAWVMTIAQHRLLTAARGLRRHRSRFRAMVEETIVASTDDGSDEADAQASLQALQCCLSDLSPQASDLIDRRYRQGQAVMVIAAQVGKRANAVAKALHSLRQRLQACVGRRLREMHHG